MRKGSLRSWRVSGAHSPVPTNISLMVKILVIWGDVNANKPDSHAAGTARVGC